MRESFSLRILWIKDPQTKKRKIWAIDILARYHNGAPIWKMIIDDTVYDIKKLLTNP